MEDIELKIYPGEKSRLKYYAERIFESGHWGSSNIEIPEEQILYKKIINAEDKIQLTNFEIGLLAEWISDATGEGTVLLPEDISIVEKILDELSSYYNTLRRRYLSELKKIEKIIGALNKVSIKKKTVTGVDPIPEMKIKIKEDPFIMEVDDNIKSELEVPGDFSEVIKENHKYREEEKKAYIQEKEELEYWGRDDKAKISYRDKLDNFIKFSSSLFTGIKNFFNPKIEEDRNVQSSEKELSAKDMLKKAETQAKKIKNIKKKKS